MPLLPVHTVTTTTTLEPLPITATITSTDFSEAVVVDMPSFNIQDLGVCEKFEFHFKGSGGAEPMLVSHEAPAQVDSHAAMC